MFKYINGILTTYNVDDYIPIKKNSVYILQAPTMNIGNKVLIYNQSYYYDQTHCRMVLVNAYIQLWEFYDDQTLRYYVADQIIWMEINSYNYGIKLPINNF